MHSKIVITAPGKVILHGEHAVVHGRSAIAASLGLKTRLILSPNERQTIKVNFSSLEVTIEWKLSDIQQLECENQDSNFCPSASYVQHLKEFLCDREKHLASTRYSTVQALTMFLYIFKTITSTYGQRSLLGYDIEIDTELTLGAGMGSSASYAVCLSAAFLKVYNAIGADISSKDMELISTWAFRAETICHGKPSGIDNSICTYGGALLFSNGKIQANLCSLPPIHILLVDTGVSRNTKALVEKVREKMNKHKLVVEQIMNAIDSISTECWTLLENAATGDGTVVTIRNMEELIVMNQHLLNSLGVGHKKLDMICEAVEVQGCAAKLTGAGGGGCAIVLIPTWKENAKDVADTLKASLTSLGFKYFDVILGGKGVNIEVQLS